MTSHYPIDKLRKLKGLENAMYIDPLADSNGNSIRYLYKFKLFNSAINLVKNKMLNIIGDFSKYKLAISYNNYLDIIYKKNIQGGRHQYNREKKKLVNLMLIEIFYIIFQVIKFVRG